jgi:prepilin-type N-terminal cleavage/methylation domain-containing protein
MKPKGFTLIEMLVVMGIIAIVAGVTIPMLIPMFKTRALDAAVDMVKQTCISARSMAVMSRHMMNVTFLIETDSHHGPGMIVTNYDDLRSTVYGYVTSGGPVDTIYDSSQNWTIDMSNMVVYLVNGDHCQIRKIKFNTDKEIVIYEQVGQPYDPTYPNDPNQLDWEASPSVGSVYVVPTAIPKAIASKIFCAHYLGNYEDPTLRFQVLRTVSLFDGQTVKYLPDGIGLRLDSIDVTSGWTYIFIPDGEVWTVPSLAQNTYNLWYKTTCMKGGKIYGPTLVGLGGQSFEMLGLYAMTGQMVAN